MLVITGPLAPAHAFRTVRPLRLADSPAVCMPRFWGYTWINTRSRVGIGYRLNPLCESHAGCPEIFAQRENRWVRTFRRYVAIGDSSTEGLEDPDGEGGYRGWADRLAEIIANAQAEPLDYANLGVRSLQLSEIRTTQFDAAMAMQPDLLSIFGGANDLLSVTCDFAGIRADLAAIFGEARSQDITVVTFTMPDPSSVNPFGRRLHGRMLQLNDIIRTEADGTACLSWTSSTTRSSRTPACSPRTGCTATNSATSAWRPRWPGGSASRAPTSRGPNHSLRRRPGCGLVNSSPRTSTGPGGTSRPGLAGASGEAHTAPDLPRNGPC